jgi:hypothetical protein
MVSIVSPQKHRVYWSRKRNGAKEELRFPRADPDSVFPAITGLPKVSYACCQGLQVLGYLPQVKDERPEGQHAIQRKR